MIMEILDYITGWAQTSLGQFHLGLALTALVLGPIIFLSNKGTNTHKIIGYIFIFSMLATNITALMSYNLTGGFNLFHFAALCSLATLLPALYFIKKAINLKSEKHYIIHGILMSWSYFGLISAFIAEVYTRELPYMLHGEGGWTRFIISFALFLSIASWVTHKITSTLVPKIIFAAKKSKE